MYLQYPLEAVARLRGTRSQIEFATEAKRLLRDTDDVLFEPMDRGLVIFAANEEAIEESARILDEAYDGKVQVRAPVVRLIPGEPVQQPVMYVGVTARREHAGVVVQKLRDRGVAILEETLRRREVAVRGEAPLADVLGLPAELAQATGGSASHVIRLTHYAPLPAQPGLPVE
jgi:translation elongation factor EF-G